MCYTCDLFVVLCTGSVYCDNVLRVSGMNGESVRSGAVLVVKTHKPFPTAWTDEDKPRMSSDKPAAKVGLWRV